MLTFGYTAPRRSCPLYSELLLDDTLHKPSLINKSHNYLETDYFHLVWQHVRSTMGRNVQLRCERFSMTLANATVSLSGL